MKGTVNGQNVTLDLSGLGNCATSIENMVIGVNANGASISPDPRVARDYSQPVQFTLTAPDGTKVVYTVTVKGAECLPGVLVTPVTPVNPTVPDTTPPVITVLGTNPLTLTVGTAYTEAGATCVDNKDPACTVVTTGTVNTAAVGSYTITYTATDVAGNASSKTRTVNVTAAPVVPCTAAANASTGYSLVFKVCSAANVAEYYDKTECVRDNATGLISQGQTPAGTGLRANDQYKTNFDNLSELQIWTGNTSTAAVVPTQSDIDAFTNSIGFRNAINASNLCGSGTWRLPTRDELYGLVEGAIVLTADDSWFPNFAKNKYYWSSTPLSSSYYNSAAYAWAVGKFDVYNFVAVNRPLRTVIEFQQLVLLVR